MSPNTIKYLQGLARRKTEDDDSIDFNPMKHFAGNAEDAYNGGVEDGETLLAQRLLAEQNLTW